MKLSELKIEFGMKLRRPTFPEGFGFEVISSDTFESEDHFFLDIERELSIEDYLADDWEICE